jgi:transposase
MKSRAKFKSYSPDQLFLLPPDMKEWLPEDDLIYFIMDVVGSLDLDRIYGSYDGSAGGQPPYDPEMMVSLLLYAYCVGIVSSRKIEQATYHSVPFRVLAGNRHPDHDTIAEFRNRHLNALGSLFVDVLRLCQKAGLVKFVHVSLDGTKMKANASNHIKYEAKKRGYDDKPGRKGRPPAAPSEEDEKPDPKKQRNFTDSDSRIMPVEGNRYFVQGYNCHAAVDDQAQVIVASHVTQETNDKKQLEAALAKLKGNTGGAIPKRFSTDSGYYSDANCEALASASIDAYIAADKKKHSDALPFPPRGRIPKNATIGYRMARKLLTIKGQRIYSKRKYTVEPVFGQIKEARGFRRFSFRGLEHCQDEWDLVCLTHNLLKLFRHGNWKPQLA